LLLIRTKANSIVYRENKKTNVLHDHTNGFIFTAKIKLPFVLNFVSLLFCDQTPPKIFASFFYIHTQEKKMPDLMFCLFFAFHLVSKKSEDRAIVFFSSCLYSNNVFIFIKRKRKKKRHFFFHSLL